MAGLACQRTWVRHVQRIGRSQVGEGLQAWHVGDRHVRTVATRTTGRHRGAVIKRRAAERGCVRCQQAANADHVGARANVAAHTIL